MRAAVTEPALRILTVLLLTSDQLSNCIMADRQQRTQVVHNIPCSGCDYAVQLAQQLPGCQQQPLACRLL